MILAANSRARLSRSADDIARAVALRGLAFRGDHQDQFDDRATQLLVETEDGTLLACLRLLPLVNGSEIASSYSATYYDLAPFYTTEGPIVEIGRFCQLPGVNDPAILRVAWTALAAQVLSNGTKMFIGCSSFRGADPALHLPALAALRAKYLFPADLQPLPQSPEVFDFASIPLPDPDPRGIPPLLRSYLAIGGQVSSHAVIDHQLDTLHVFTALNIAAIPPERARLLTAAVLDGGKGAR